MAGNTTAKSSRLLIAFYPLLILAFAVAVFFGKQLTKLDDLFIGGNDVTEYFFWHALFIKKQYLSGNIPFWNPHYNCGHPFLANPQAFVLYPSTLLYIFLDVPRAINIDTLLHIFIAMAGCYYFAYIITSSKPAGIAAGIVYGLNGYFMNNVLAGHLTMIHTAALLPWIFYFLERAVLSGRFYFFGLSGIVFALQILGGEPQNSFYTILFLSLYFCIRMFVEFQKKANVFKRIRGYLLLLLTGFCLSAPQILPSLEFMVHSDRSENKFQFSSFFSFPLENLITFLAPEPMSSTKFINTNWEFGCYFGVVSIVIAMTGFVLFNRKLFRWTFFLFIIFALTIMLGKITPLFSIYSKIIPGLTTFRIHARCILFVVFPAAMLAGMGIQFLCQNDLNKNQYIRIFLSALSLLLCLLLGAKLLDIPLHTKGILVSIGLILSSVLPITLMRISKYKSIGIAAIIGLLFLDLFIAYADKIPLIDAAGLIERNRAEDVIREDKGIYRVIFPLGALRGMAYGYYNVNGYTPIVLNTYLTFVYGMAGLPLPALKKNTLHPLLFSRELLFSSRILGIKYAVAVTESGFAFKEAKRVYPHAVLAKDVFFTKSEGEQLALLKSGRIDPMATVLIEASYLEKIAGLRQWASRGTRPEGGHISQPLSDEGNQVEIVSYEANRIGLKTSSPSDSILLLSELYYPGWEAYIDGKKTTVMKADYLMRALYVPKGDHAIVFAYKPASFYAGIAITVLSLILFVLARLPAARKRKPIHANARPTISNTSVDKFSAS